MLCIVFFVYNEIISTKTVNILAFVLGFLGIVIYIVVLRWLSKRTDKIIKSLDEKAKAIMRHSQKDEKAENEGGREKGNPEVEC